MTLVGLLTFPHSFGPGSFAGDPSRGIKVRIVALYVRNSQRKFELKMESGMKGASGMGGGMEGEMESGRYSERGRDR